MNCIILRIVFSHRRFIALVFTLCFTTILFSQTSFYSISGTALTKDNKPIEFGNVIALSIKDSSLLKGVPFQNGDFKLDGILIDSVIIKISSIGYSDFVKAVVRQNSDSIINLGKIVLKEDNTLSEITVSAKTPLFEMDGEKVKVNVEKTALNSAGNALDVLRRSPGIMVSNSDNVSVFGKGAAIIYLDGLLISSTDILKSLPSNEIKSIEIIRNPSSKYDAAGMAVINITTIRNSLQGYTGNIIQNVLIGKYVFTYSGFRLSQTKNKWTTNFSYGNNLGTQWNSDEYKRTYKTSDTVNIAMNNYIY